MRRLALLLIAAVACREPVDDTYRHTVSLQPYLVPPMYTEQMAKVYSFMRFEAQSDLLTVQQFLGGIPFEGIELPPGAEFHGSLRVWRERNYRADSVDVTAVQRLVDGNLVESTVRVTLDTNEKKAWTAFTLPLGGEVATSSFHLRFATPNGERTPPKMKIALLRPHATWDAPQRPIPPESRQVIFVTLDTLRRDHLGCYGATDVRTPNLDAFAEDAHLFENAFSTTNVTNPSHVSMFTSLHLKDHGVLDNFARLAPDCPNIIDGLGDAGFRTAAFVSSFNFKEERSDLPERFEQFFGCPEYFERRAEDVQLDLFRWLGNHHDEDFFVWAHYFDAHMPYVPPYPYNTWYTDESTEKIQLPLREEEGLGMYDYSDDLSWYRNMYRGEVSYLDAQLGRLWELLRDLDLYDRALIVVVADHGEHLGENGIYCEHRGLYDHTTAVPMLIKFPGNLYAGRSEALTSTLDLYPTIYDTLGFDLEGPVRGQSLLPLVTGGELERDRVFSEHMAGHQVSVRTEELRVMLGLRDVPFFPEFALEEGKVELYEVARGQGTGDDLASERAAEASFWEEELRSFLTESMDYEATVIESEEHLEVMRKMGYVDSSMVTDDEVEEDDDDDGTEPK